MSPSAWLSHRSVGIQLGLAALGMGAFVLYSRSWMDWQHLVYDIPAGLAVFAFVAQLILEAGKDGASAQLGVRFALLAVVTVATVGREFLHWPISGHLTCVLAVALVQLADPRLPLPERVLYGVPLPIVLLLRWTRFDEGDHAQTYYALLVGCLAAVPSILVARFRLS